MSIPFIGLKKQYHNLRQEILDATDEVMRSGQLMNGNFTAEFENWLARRNNVKYAVTLHSGTQALECLASFVATEDSMPGLPRVLIPSISYVATANAFMRAGWEIQFIDVDSHGLMDINKIPANVEYSAICLVGLYGASVSALTDLHRWKKNARVLTPMYFIEDAAQHWLSDNCHRFGLGAALSFDPTKNLAAYGNGGAIVTDSSDLYRHALSWREHGKPSNDMAGTNSRMSEIDCAQMLVKARHIDAWQIKRRTIANYWTERFKGANLRCLINKDNAREHCFHKFVIDVDKRDILARNLALRNIETKVHYNQPLHEIGNLRQWPGPDILSSASALCRRVLSLPIYPELTDLQVEYIADQVIDCANS